MRLVTFHGPDGLHVGTVAGDEVVDLAAAAPDLPREMTALLAAGRRRARRPCRARATARVWRSSGVRLTAPVPRPPKFLAIGLNYADHVAESGTQTPDVPAVFNKQSTCVIGPGEPIHMPRASSVRRLRGRARLRDRPALPPRAARARARGHRRLPGRQRRQRARLAAPHARP